MSSVFKGPTQIVQKANGLNIAQSLYGQTIPYIFGNVKTSHKLIFADNFQATPAQEGKKGSKKGGGATQYYYTVNADLIIGYGPLEGVGTIWQNQVVFAGWYGTQVSTGIGEGTTFSFNVTVPDGCTFVMVTGVAYTPSFLPTHSYSDFVYLGTNGTPIFRTFNQTDTDPIPLYNNHYPAPNSGSWQYANKPYATYNTSTGDDVVTITFPTLQLNPVVTIYYEYYNNALILLQKLANSQAQAGKGGKKSGGPPPLSGTGLVFEQVLGDGTSGNPISYSDFSGSGGANIALGPTPEFPHINFEVKGLFGIGNPSPAANFDPNFETYTPSTTSGDCNPADIIADLICSGNISPTSDSAWNHGLGFSSLIVRNRTVDNLSNPYHYSRFGGILKDEPNLWGPSFNGGTNLGLNALRNFCGSYGIFISGVMDAQQSGAQVIADLCRLANSAPCYDGVGLDFIPYCEVSHTGNQYNYVSQSASGPIFNLTESDILEATDNGPIVSTYDRASENINSYTVPFSDKTLQFNDNAILISDTGDMVTQGSMAGSLSLPSYLTNENAAQIVGWAQLRRNLIAERYVYSFKIQPYWASILTLMDLITIPDPTAVNEIIALRITSISITKDGVECQGEQYIYGANSPGVPNGAAVPGAGGGNGGGGDPGPIYCPLSGAPVKLYGDPSWWDMKVEPQEEFYIITTESGRQGTFSPMHRIYHEKGLIRIKDIEVGTKVLTEEGEEVVVSNFFSKISGATVDHYEAKKGHVYSAWGFVSHNMKIVP